MKSWTGNKNKNKNGLNAFIIKKASIITENIQRFMAVYIDYL